MRGAGQTKGALAAVMMVGHELLAWAVAVLALAPPQCRLDGEPVAVSATIAVTELGPSSEERSESSAPSAVVRMEGLGEEPPAAGRFIRLLVGRRFLTEKRGNCTTSTRTPPATISTGAFTGA